VTVVPHRRERAQVVPEHPLPPEPEPYDRQRPALARTIVIDDGWLNRQGRGPFILDQPGTRYVLATDVRTDGTAFVVKAGAVELDLNGHAVTYGDRAAPTIRNAGFEEGTERDVPGWDLSEAPRARLADNSRLLFGKRVLRLESFGTTQRIVSDPIQVDWPGRAHMASITPANPEARAKLTLSVLDALTGEVLGKGTSSNPSRGFAALAKFTPRRAGAVRLQIDVTPIANVTTSLDLDEATLTVVGDYGVLASRAWTGELAGFTGLSSRAQAAYRARKAGHVCVRNGKLLQGRGRGHASSPLFFRSLPGVRVEGVETLARGLDTESLDATGASEQVSVRKCTFRHEVANISNRMRCFATLKLNNIHGRVEVEGNRLIDCPQIGIMLAANDPRQTVRICRNEIRQNCVVTNGYAILFSATQNFTITENVIRPVSGKGISLDSYSRGQLGPGVVRGNTIVAQERPNREYPASLESVALRLRNTADLQGPQKGVRVENNYLEARCGPGQVQNAYAARISYANKAGAMNHAGVVLRNNTLRAVITSSAPQYHARALVLDRLETGVDLTMTGNRLESNDVSLALADTTGGVEEALLLSNTFRRVGDTHGRRYSAILAGYYNRDVKAVRVISPRCEAGVTPGITWEGTGTKEVRLGWLLDVQVLNSDGTAGRGVSVEVLDREGRRVYSGLTNSDGSVRAIQIVTSVHRQQEEPSHRAAEDKRGPHEVVITDGGRTVREKLDLRSDRTLKLRLP
jgi:hypothetical protein